MALRHSLLGRVDNFSDLIWSRKSNSLNSCMKSEQSADLSLKNKNVDRIWEIKRGRVTGREHKSYSVLPGMKGW